jgi:acetyl esterase/lipase
MKQNLIKQSLKLTLKGAVKPIMGSKLPVGFQRKWLEWLSSIPPVSTAIPKEVIVTRQSMGHIQSEKVSYTKTKELSGKVILYLHGGAFYLGSAKTHRSITSHLSKITGFPVFAPEYRLAPEHPFPAALDDAMACFHWLIEEGIAAKDIIIAGDSAGGGLTVATCLGIAKKEWPMPGALILFSPWVNLLMSETDSLDDKIDPLLSWDFVRKGAHQYLHGRLPDHSLQMDFQAANNPLISVIKAELKTLPPTLIQFGSEEILKPQIKAFIKQLDKYKVSYLSQEYEKLWHVFQLHAGLMTEADHALMEVSAFLDTHLD